MRREEKNKKIREARRRLRTRKKLLSQGGIVRLSVFRSNKHMYAQIIDDAKSITVASVSEKEIKDEKLNKTLRAKELGQKLAEKALGKKIKNVVFDKGPYRYHGRVKALAEGAREGGLVF